MRLGVTMLAGLLLIAPLSATAQAGGEGERQSAIGAPSPATGSTSSEARGPAVIAQELALERSAQRGERHAEGIWLLTYGIGSIVVGGAIAGVGHADPFWLWAGIGSAGWGLINLWFGLPMLDLGGRQAREIEAERALGGEALERRIEDLASDQYGAAGVFAFNGGLDVFYIATGVFLTVIGAELLEPRSIELAGYGVAMAAQGLGLLIYDVFGWIRAQERGHRLQRIER